MAAQTAGREQRAAGSAPQDAGQPTDGARHAVGRRGLVAGAAALVAGFAAKRTSQQVAADTIDTRFYADGTTGFGFDSYEGDFDTGVRGAGSTEGVYGTGGGKFGAGSTGVGVRGLGAGGAQGVYGTGGSSNGRGVQGDGRGSGYGVYGTGGNNSGYGVVGLGGGPNGVGVAGGGVGTGQGVQGVSVTTGVEGLGFGDNSSNTTGLPIGVRGSVPNTGYGVYGNAGNGTGVYGVAPGGYGVNGVTTTGIGVYGQAASGASQGVYGKHTGGGYGVYGEGVNGRGVYGIAPSGFGVQGVSTSLHGVIGQSTSGVGVVGTSTSSSGVVGGSASAVSGTAGGYFYNTANNGSGVVGQVFASTGAVAFVGAANPPNFAAYFTGTVVVQGQLVVSDPSYKSGALAHPDGSHRLVYCVESPESWIEDVGTGTLAGGKASVTFDKDFAAVTDTDTYHVFLTEYGDHHALYVETQAVTGFTVRAKSDPTASGRFSWKVMMKAKSSVKSERLGKFTMPQIKLADAPPHVPDLPTAPTPPKKP